MLRARFLSAFLFITLICTSTVPLNTWAAFNSQINYQGKLTDTAGDPVADGDYLMIFRLYTSATGATNTNIWEEVRSTAGDKATVVDGLFSVMIGSSTPLTGVDFNQTLYLGVEVCGTASLAGCDGEMTPRKVLGSVPAAFVAKELDGSTDIGIGTTTPFGQLNVASSTKPQFVITDTAGGANAKHWYASSTNGSLAWGTVNDSLSSLTERIRFTNAGNVGIGTTSPYAKLSVVGETVSTYFTATSTTATSTFAGILSVGSSTPSGNPSFVVGTSFPSLFVSKSNGNVGVRTDNVSRYDIGAFSGGASLSVMSGDGLDNIHAIRLESYNDGSTLAFTRALDTQAAPSLLSADADVGMLTSYGYDGTDYAPLTTIKFSADNAGDIETGDNDMPGRMTFHTTPDGSDNPLERMRIDNKGRIGINTAVLSGLSPMTMLTVNGTTTGTDGYSFVARTSADDDVLVVRNDVHVGIATSSPWLSFSVNGQVGFSANLSAESGSDNVLCIDPTTYEVTDGGAACGASSQRFKNQIEDLDYGLADVLALRPVSFHYKASERRDGEDNRNVGFIAEEMVDVIPEVVEYDKEGLPGGIDYAKLTAVLAKAIQDLYHSLQNLQGETINYVTATFGKLTAQEVVTDRLCVGATCVTAEEFLIIVGNSGVGPTPTPSSESSNDDDDNDNATTTDLVVEENPIMDPPESEELVEPEVQPDPVSESEPIPEL